MPKSARKQSTPITLIAPPPWLVRHMIALSEYAEDHGLSAFQAMLIEATEGLILDINRPRPPCPDGRARPVKVDSKVVPFRAAMRSPGARANTSKR